jgi:2-oxoisovalerate dehydrogenase E1 component
MMNSSDIKVVVFKYTKELEKAVQIRLVETRLLSLFKEGLINGTVHTCVGQELTGVFVSKYLNLQDYVFSNHRGHGHFISRTSKVRELFFELMGKKNGACHGIGGSQHLYDKNYLSNGIQGGMTPIAAGTALHLKKSGTSNISVVYIGDGTLGEGILYEALNICGKWGLPVLFVLENNKYAQSTSQSQTFAGDLGKRMEGFGIKYLHTDIWDLTHLDNSISTSIEQVRKGQPFLLEIDCYRLNPHSKGDDNRKDAELEEYRIKDPVNIFLKDYPDIGNAMISKYEDELNKMVEDAMAEEDLDQMPNLPQYLNEDCEFSKISEDKLSGEKYNTLVYQSLKEILQGGNSYLIGEDIEGTNVYTEKLYGGAFKVTRDLSGLFPGRVLNTPISEAAITGISIGLAITGNTAIAEIMFGDFTTLIFDQLLQHASKFYGMTRGNVKVPLIIRTPMGGYRGYGPTHSQSIEKHFMGIPYLNVIALNKYLDPRIVYRKLKNESMPSFVIENKILYTKSQEDNISVFNYAISNEKYPSISIRPKSSIRDFTIVCYGGMLDIAEKAAYRLLVDHDIFCELIVPSRLNILNIAPILQSLKKTNKLIVIEEGSNIASFSGTLASALLQQRHTQFQYYTLANNNIIPSSYKAELSLLPSEESIIDTIMLNYRKPNV